MDLVLYSGEGCSLCDEAIETLERMGLSYRVEHDPEMAERIPVITVGGRVISEGPVNERALRRAVRRARSGA